MRSWLAFQQKRRCKTSVKLEGKKFNYLNVDFKFIWNQKNLDDADNCKSSSNKIRYTQGLLPNGHIMEKDTLTGIPANNEVNGKINRVYCLRWHRWCPWRQQALHKPAAIGTAIKPGTSCTAVAPWVRSGFKIWNYCQAGAHLYQPARVRVQSSPLRYL